MTTKNKRYKPSVEADVAYVPTSIYCVNHMCMFPITINKYRSISNTGCL